MTKFLVFTIVAFVIGGLAADMPAPCYSVDKIAMCSRIELDGFAHNRRVVWSTVDAVRTFP